MDSVEEAGLRAFTLLVGRHDAGDPAWIESAGVRIPVDAIDARWREEERLGYRIRLSDGSYWLLYYVPELELWSGIADAGAGHGGGSEPPR